MAEVRNSYKMRKPVRQATVSLAALLMLVLVGETAHGQRAFLNRLKKIYELKPAIASCHLCHDFDKDKGEEADKKNINALAKEIQASPKAKPAMGKGDEHKFTPAELQAIEDAVKDLESKDTDGDGATNGEEIRLGTFPARKDSTPKKEELEQYRKKNPGR